MIGLVPLEKGSGELVLLHVRTQPEGCHLQARKRVLTKDQISFDLGLQPPEL